MSQQAIEFLKQQLLGQKESYEWDASGVDRAQELAQQLFNAGITDISKLKMGTRDVTNKVENGTQVAGDGFYGDGTFRDEIEKQNYFDYDGRQIGYIGGGQHAGDKFVNTKKGDNEFSWSSKGKGNVGYFANPREDGTLSLGTKWGSSSDMDTIRDVAKMAAMVGGIGWAGNAGLLGSAVSGGQAAGGLGTYAGVGEGINGGLSAAQAATQAAGPAWGAAGATGGLMQAVPSILPELAAPYEMSSVLGTAGTPGGWSTGLEMTGGSGLLNGIKQAGAGLVKGITDNPLKAAGLLGGAIAGAQSGGDETATRTSKLDPNMEKYLYGSGYGDKNSYMGAAQDWFNQNRSGMNDTMRQGLLGMKQAYTDPRQQQSIDAIRTQGQQGLLGRIATNPFLKG